MQENIIVPRNGIYWTEIPPHMTHKLLLTILCTCCLVGFSQAQRDSLPQLTLSFGPAHLSRQDLLFSPFVHNDVAPFTMGLRYEKNKKVHQFVRLDYAGFSAGIVTPYDYLLDGAAETAYPHSFTFIGLDYGQGYWIGGNDKTQSLLGGSINVDIQAMTYQYGRFSFFGYYANFGLGAWYKHIFQLTDRHRLTAQIEVPLVSWMARSPYLVNDDEFIENIYSHNGFTTFFAYLGDGELVTWNKLQTVNAGLEYQYALSDKWTIGAGWQFAFIHASKPLALTSVQNNLSVVVGLRL